MKGCIALWLGVAVTACGLLASDPPKDDKKEPANLILNGGFEEGKDTPIKWQKTDGLTSFWVDDPGKKRGKVIKFDTDVLQSQGYEWWAKIHGGAKALDAPMKLPTVAPKYDTLAGLDGVWFWSDFIPVEKGKAYWLTMDIKSEGPDVMAWLVGYEKKESEEFGADANAFQEYLMEKKLKAVGKVLDRKRNFDSIINKYVYRGQLNARYSKALPDGWRQWTRDKLPMRPAGKMTPRVRFARVLVLPYWPPGVCYLDNVRLTEVPDGGKK